VYKKKDKIGKVKRVFTKRERDMPWDMSYLEKDHKTNSYKPETLVGTKEELPSHYCLVAKVRGCLFLYNGHQLCDDEIAQYCKYT
jgi:hypothetical protein